MAKFLSKAIKKPGRVKAAAKRAGISVHAEAEKMAHTKGGSHEAKSARSAGNLALRFQGGEFKHKKGGSTTLKSGSMKAKALDGRSSNLRTKKEFVSGAQDARKTPNLREGLGVE